MRGKRAKAHRRALVATNAQLANAVNENRSVAIFYRDALTSYMWQAFWQGIALASLLAYLEARRGSADGPMAVCPWDNVERSVWFWPADVQI
jgi:hypothetical protein